VSLMRELATAAAQVWCTVLLHSLRGACMLGKEIGTGKGAERIGD
jgi:hypothetical protein